MGETLFNRIQPQIIMKPQHEYLEISPEFDCGHGKGTLVFTMQGRRNSTAQVLRENAFAFIQMLFSLTFMRLVTKVHVLSSLTVG